METVTQEESTEIDFTEIEVDPDAFCQDLDIEMLEGLIEMASDIYYNNSDPKQKYLSDNAYDCMVYHLNKKTRNKDQALAKIGALPNKRLRTNLPFYMPSLNKVKIGNGLESFLNSTNNPIVWSLKLDGISVMIVYEDYQATKAYLRGNGILGGEISFILDHITLPRLTDFSDMVVRGEMIMSKKNWFEIVQKSKGGSKDNTVSRNYVSGILNAGHVSPNLQYIDFVAYDIVYLNMEVVPSPAESLCLLESQGFNVVKFGVFEEKALASDILNLYRTWGKPQKVEDEEDETGKNVKNNKQQDSTYEYVIDGIVLAIEEERFLPTTLINPANTVAFKINLDEQIRETEIIKIHWNISRHGRLIPVAEFKTVFIDGCKVHRSTVTNASNCIKKHKLGVGTRIKVTRSGQVIPKIVSVVECCENQDIKTSLPHGSFQNRGKESVPATGFVLVNSKRYFWHWKGLDIVLDDPESCPEVHLKRFVHFFTVLNIKGIREGMLRKITDSGLNTLDSILNASKARLMEIRGIGPKKSDAYVNDIKTGLGKVKLYRLMIASNCFPMGMGKTFIRQITDAIPDILNNHRYPIDLQGNNNLYNSLVSLKGIGKVRATNFIEGLKKFKEFVKAYPNVEENNRKFLQELDKNGYNRKIKNKAFVFTNLDDDELEDYILDNHGAFSKSVDRATTAVITGNICAMSTKQLEASKLGIKVYTLNEFKEQFDVKM